MEIRIGFALSIIRTLGENLTDENIKILPIFFFWLIHSFIQKYTLYDYHVQCTENTIRSTKPNYINVFPIFMHLSLLGEHKI